MMTAVKTLPEPRPGDILGALIELGLTGISRATGDELFILCPYHQDKTVGSFSINLRTGLNSCFSCGQGGSFHKFLMAVSSMNRQQARRWCLQRLIVTTDPRAEIIQHDQQDIVNEASLALFTEPPNWACEKRKVTVAACKALEILWNPASRFTGSWIFPIRDMNNLSLMGWQEKRGKKMLNYPPGVPVKCALFGWGCNLGTQPRVVLVESPLDVAVMWDAGFTCAVASYGSPVSDAQLDLIEEAFEGLVLALDDDRAGWEATDKIMRRSMSIPRHVFQYQEGCKGKDPGELDDDQIRWGMRNLLC